MLLILRSIVFVMVVGACTGLAVAQNVKAEVDDVAHAVLTKTDWVREAQVCPKAVMASKAVTDYLSRDDCKSGQLSDCFKKCSAGTARACYWLAYALQQESAPSDSYEPLYQRSCKLGVMSGCTNRAAGMLKVAPEDERAKVCAAQTFDAVCAFDDPWACTMSALHLSHGIGVKKDIARALKSLEKSCKYGPDDEACIYGERIRYNIQQPGQ